MSGRERPKAVQDDHRTLHVAFATLDDFRREYEANLARGGLFIATEEAVEDPARPELLAVQWHPELELAPESPQRRLLEAFVALAAARTNPR